MINVMDIGIIGMGVAGCFTAYKLAKEHKGIKILGIDLGRPPQKRRRQLEGWLGCLPNSDGKFYLNDQEKVATLVGTRKAKSSLKWMSAVIENVSSFKTIKDKGPSVSAEKRIKKNGYDLELNDYIQVFPKEIHALSKFMADGIELAKNVTFSFDNEVISIIKQKNIFVITTQNQEFRCKKILIAVGRSGWRWASDLYSKFGIIESNNFARFGIRVEMPANHLKDFNKSNFTMYKGASALDSNHNDLEIGPMSWFGTVIPEDHIDLAISSFRSNENRWKTDKVSFSLIGNRFMEKGGSDQTDRIGKLTFVLANDRIVKEKISTIIAKKSKISIMPEYDWLSEELIQLSSVIPDLLNKAYFHVPTITPLIPHINIGNNLETEIDGLFVAGESAGITGILSAACTGIIAADSICK